MKVALIGYGYWGRNLARVINRNPYFKLDIICEKDIDKNPEIALAYPNVKVLNDYSNISNEVNAVFVSTPTITHFNISSFFLEKKIHVFCEKPLSTNLSEIEALDKLSKKNNCILMVGHIFEFNTIVQKIKKMLDEKELGDLLYISMMRAGLGPVRDDVNVLYDLATHDISILNFWLKSSPIDIKSSSSCFLNIDKEDLFFIILGYDNKLKVNIQVSWIEPQKERIIKIVGTKKMVIFNDTSISSKLKIYETGESYQKLNGDFGAFQLSLNDGDIYIPKIDYGEPLADEIEHFAECISKNLSPLSDVKSAFEVVKILNKIESASKC